jgi:hypothetical protein
VGPGPDQFAQLALGLVKAGMRARTPQAPNTAGASLGMRILQGWAVPSFSRCVVDV